MNPFNGGAISTVDVSCLPSTTEKESSDQEIQLGVTSDYASSSACQESRGFRAALT